MSRSMGFLKPNRDMLTSAFATASSDSPVLSSLRHGALLPVRRKLAAGKHREIHDVEQRR